MSDHYEPTKSDKLIMARALLAKNSKGKPKPQKQPVSLIPQSYLENMQKYRETFYRPQGEPE